MAAKAGADRWTGSADKRGGYQSSSKLASALKPPPSGPAPGAVTKQVTTPPKR